MRGKAFSVLWPARIEELTNTATAIAGHLARKDPIAAQAWIGTLADGRVKDSATTELSRFWAVEDPAAASVWIKTMPAGDVRDESVRSLVRTIFTRDIAAAYEWARSISNEDSRKETIYQVIESWKLQDPESARAAEAAAGGDSPAKNP